MSKYVTVKLTSEQAKSVALMVHEAVDTAPTSDSKAFCKRILTTLVKAINQD